MLVELGLVEQRYQAVREVLDDGASVTEVARRYGVARQTVHSWLRRYANSGLAGLADRSCRPASCPHQMAPAVETRVVELRRTHPGWGPRRIVHQLGRDGMVPVPGRSSVYRALVRHGLIDPKRMIQIGIRGSVYSADEKDWAESAGIRIVHIEEFFRLGPDQVIAGDRREIGGATAVGYSALVL